MLSLKMEDLIGETYFDIVGESRDNGKRFATTKSSHCRYKRRRCRTAQSAAEDILRIGKGGMRLRQGEAKRIKELNYPTWFSHSIYVTWRPPPWPSPQQPHRPFGDTPPLPCGHDARGKRTHVASEMCHLFLHSERQQLRSRTSQHTYAATISKNLQALGATAASALLLTSLKKRCAPYLAIFPSG